MSLWNKISNWQEIFLSLLYIGSRVCGSLDSHARTKWSSSGRASNWHRSNFGWSWSWLLHREGLTSLSFCIWVYYVLIDKLRVHFQALQELSTSTTGNDYIWFFFVVPPRLMVLMSLRVEQTSENLVLLLSPFLITTTTNATTAVAVATTLFQ